MKDLRKASRHHAARVCATAAVFVVLATSNRAFEEPLQASNADIATTIDNAVPVRWNAYGPAGGRIQGVEIVVTPFY